MVFLKRIEELINRSLSKFDSHRISEFDIKFVYEILDLVIIKANEELQDRINRNPYEKSYRLHFCVDISKYPDSCIERSIIEINRRPKWEAKEFKTKKPIKSINSKHYLAVTISDEEIEDINKMKNQHTEDFKNDLLFGNFN